MQQSWYWEHYTEAEGRPARGTVEVHIYRFTDSAIIFAVIAEAELLDTEIKVELLSWDETVEPGDDPTPTAYKAISKRDAAWEKVVGLTPQLVKIKQARRTTLQRVSESYGYVPGTRTRLIIRQPPL